jgi:hypothetical protein
MKMSEVWVSLGMVELDCRIGFQSDVFERDTKDASLAQNENKKGKAVDPSRLPAKLVAQTYIDGDEEHIVEIDDRWKALPQFFFNGIPYVSDKAAKIMMRHDVGNLAFYPLEIFQPDGVKPISGRWHVMNFANARTTIVPEQSKYIRANAYITPPLYHPDDLMKDGALAISADSIQGPQVWVDPRLVDAFFLGAEVVRDLQAAGIAKDFKLRRCTIAA